MGYYCPYHFHMHKNTIHLLLFSILWDVKILAEGFALFETLKRNLYSVWSCRLFFILKNLFQKE